MEIRAVGRSLLCTGLVGVGNEDSRKEEEGRGTNVAALPSGFGSPKAFSSDIDPAICVAPVGRLSI